MSKTIKGSLDEGDDTDITVEPYDIGLTLLTIKPAAGERYPITLDETATRELIKALADTVKK